MSKVNCMLKKNGISNVTEVNNTTYAAAAYISELAGANYLPKKKKRSPGDKDG